MPIGIRMQDLRKVYTSPRPMAAAGAMFAGLIAFSLNRFHRKTIG